MIPFVHDAVNTVLARDKHTHMQAYTRKAYSQQISCSSPNGP